MDAFTKHPHSLTDLKKYLNSKLTEKEIASFVTPGSSTATTISAKVPTSKNINPNDSQYLDHNQTLGESFFST